MSPEKTKKIPAESIWRFEGVEEQIRLEFGHINWEMAFQEPQKAFYAFYWMLIKIIHDPESHIEVDKKKAQDFVDLYLGTGHEKKDATVMERGLHALDLIQWDFTDEDELGALCRGYDAKRLKKKGRTVVQPLMSPRTRHSYVMRFYEKMIPLMMELWHEIAEEVTFKGRGMSEQDLEWIRQNDAGLTKEATEAEEQDAIDRGLLLQGEVNLSDYPETPIQGAQTLISTDSDDLE